jgi:hypothetical protein
MDVCDAGPRASALATPGPTRRGGLVWPPVGVPLEEGDEITQQAYFSQSEPQNQLLHEAPQRGQPGLCTPALANAVPPNGDHR